MRLAEYNTVRCDGGIRVFDQPVRAMLLSGADAFDKKSISNACNSRKTENNLKVILSIFKAAFPILIKKLSEY